MKGKAIQIGRDVSGNYAHVTITCGYRDGDAFYFEMDPAAVNRTYWRLSCQLGSGNLESLNHERDPYAIEYSIGGPSHSFDGTVSLRDVPTIAKSRGKLMRALEKQNRALGYPVTFREHAARLYAAYRPEWLFDLIATQANPQPWTALGSDAQDADRYIREVDAAVRACNLALYGECEAA